MMHASENRPSEYRHDAPAVRAERSGASPFSVQVLKNVIVTHSLRQSFEYVVVIYYLCTRLAMVPGITI